MRIPRVVVVAGISETSRVGFEHYLFKWNFVSIHGRVRGWYWLVVLYKPHLYRTPLRQVLEKLPIPCFTCSLSSENIPSLMIASRGSFEVHREGRID